MTEPWTADRWTTDLESPDDEDGTQDRPVVYLADGLVTLRYLWDAVRRHARLWVGLALAGLALGALLPVVMPAGGLADTKVLVTHAEGDDPAVAVATDVRLASTRTVAGRVVDNLDLPLTTDELLEQYTVTRLTDRVIRITVEAPSDAEAVRVAEAIAETFLAFRMDQVVAEQQPAKEQLADLRSKAAALQDRFERENPLAVEPEPNSKLTRARDKADRMEQRLEEQQAGAELMSSSRVLDDAAAVPESTLQTLAVNVASGLAAGLVLGLGFVVARALLSDRVWRRQPIADALGCRIALSLGKIRGKRRPLRRPDRPDPPTRWLPPWAARRRLARSSDLARAVRHLADRVHKSRANRPTLAVVSVGDPRAGAVVMASLARSLAEGKRVLVADLSTRGVLAARLGVAEAGTTRAAPERSDGTVYVHRPEPGAGPSEGLLRARNGELRGGDRDGLSHAWLEADVVLTFVELIPSLGGEHLRSWAAQAVVAVGAGKSSTTRIRATGEMVRLAGVRLESAIVLGSDATDETVGIPLDTAEAPQSVTAAGSRW